MKSRFIDRSEQTPEQQALRPVSEIDRRTYQQRERTRLYGFLLTDLSVVEIFYVNKGTHCNGEALIEHIWPGDDVNIDYAVKINDEVYITRQVIDADNYLISPDGSRRVGFFGGNNETANPFRFTNDMLEMPATLNEIAQPPRELAAV